MISIPDPAGNNMLAWAKAAARCLRDLDRRISSILLKPSRPSEDLVLSRPTHPFQVMLATRAIPGEGEGAPPVEQLLVQVVPGTVNNLVPKISDEIAGPVALWRLPAPVLNYGSITEDTQFYVYIEVNVVMENITSMEIKVADTDPTAYITDAVGILTIATFTKPTGGAVQLVQLIKTCQTYLKGFRIVSTEGSVFQHLFLSC